MPDAPAADAGEFHATFVALLRGINVGGHNRVPMAELRAALQSRGFHRVRTYIASGNVILTAPDDPDARERIADEVAATIRDEFAVACSVLVRRSDQIVSIAAAIPESWADDPTLRADVIYLFDDVDSPEVLAGLPLRDGIDTAHYTPGAVLWSVPRDRLTRSGMTRIIGTPLYPRITVRNARTARTLATLSAPAAEPPADPAPGG